ncbi:MFS transporter [Hyphomicrobium sp.]|uniref:MFS transporter n=1 Tax=Hyphomicrobium sp. TaxID=82 RepID=UPI003F6E5DBF
MRPLLPVFAVVFVAAVGYGISFPLLGYRLEQLAVPGWMLGVNSAMPALGWVAGSALMPLLQLRFRIPIGVLAFAFLLCAAIAVVGLSFAEDFWSMTLLRFFFGGGMGLFFRSVEYWVNALSQDSSRARNLSVNGIAFMAGLMIGSAAQSSLGAVGWIPSGAILGTIILSMFLLSHWPGLTLPAAAPPSLVLVIASVSALPAAYAAGLAYGLYESVPAYLNQVYALRNGLDASTAAFALTAAAVGNIVIPLPVAIMSDRIGRIGPLAACALISGAVSLSIPSTLASPTLFLLAVGVSAGTAGTTYGLGLAMIGDRYQGADLVTANAAFGLIYAIASICGPLINGPALDTLDTNGLFVSAALIFAMLLATLAALYVQDRRRGRANV